MKSDDISSLVYIQPSKFERQIVYKSFDNFLFYLLARMPRRGGGKRIRMDDPMPTEYEEEMYRAAG